MASEVIISLFSFQYTKIVIGVIVNLVQLLKNMRKLKIIFSVIPQLLDPASSFSFCSLFDILMHAMIASTRSKSI